MKLIYSLVFFVLLVGVIFFYINNQNANKRPTLRNVVGCFDEVIDDSILDLDEDTTLIGAFVTFETMPLSEQIQQELDNLNIVLDHGSQVFEASAHVLAQIPTASLCNLAQIEGVQSIFIPQ